MEKQINQWNDLSEPAVVKEQLQLKKGETGFYFTDSEHAYFSNYSMMTKEEITKMDAKYFIFADKLDSGTTTLFPKAALANLRSYSEYSTDPIVIRVFPYGDKRHVFTDDILEIVPILMKKQGKPLKFYCKKLQHYRNIWTLKDSKSTNSLDIEEFKSVMEGFKVDKGLITIIPDAYHAGTEKQVLEQGRGAISTINRDGNIVMRPSLAVFYIFQNVVCGRRWKNDEILDKDDDALVDFYFEFERVVGKFRNMKEGVMFSMDIIESDIQTLLNNRIFTENIVGPKMTCRFSDMPYQEVIPYDWYLEERGKYDLYAYIPRTPKTEMRVYEARLVLNMEWIQEYNQPTWIQKKIEFLDGLLYTIPAEVRVEQRENIVENYTSGVEKSKRVKAEQIARFPVNLEKKKANQTYMLQYTTKKVGGETIIDAKIICKTMETSDDVRALKAAMDDLKIRKK
ncbi:hypothetical protein CAEBREN_14427 [Caenorhabditis brenneri]|uniref:EF-hand domain-containing protein n=1 Tax=Caenorhabditis brenneri TaxID=135651 RepID=G0MWX7_CAEBE|nr:hypothetical protein CAEBREN_14427 [Caenorhabditis brenneri]